MYQHLLEANSKLCLVAQQPAILSFIHYLQLSLQQEFQQGIVENIPQFIVKINLCVSLIWQTIAKACQRLNFPAATLSRQPFSTMGNRIIIYDDDKDILLVTATILEMKGYVVQGKEDCRTVDQDLSGFKPNVILMDNWLPDMGGVKAIQHIKSNGLYKDIPVIFFSANSNVEELARDAGADYMLKKPFEIAGLQQLIEQALSNAAEKTNC